MGAEAQFSPGDQHEADFMNVTLYQSEVEAAEAAAQAEQDALDQARAAPAPPHDGKDVCVICLSQPRKPVVVRCGHRYCGACIRQWCRRSLACPLCRGEIDRDALCEDHTSA